MIFPELRAACHRYSKIEGWDADKNSRSHYMPPNRTISERDIRGCKKDKKSFKFLDCSYSTGKEKFVLIFIENAQKTMCIKKRSGEEF